jgi:hypothetical protein
LTYEQFAKQYEDAFKAMSKYTLKEAGSQVYLDKMAALADEYPEFLTRFEAEVEPKPTTSKAERDRDKFNEKKKARKPKAPTADEINEQVYQPGAVVKSYYGWDKVLEYKPGGKDGSWSVRVIAVNKDGTPIKGERERVHYTAPETVDRKRAIDAILKKRGQK